MYYIFLLLFPSIFSISNFNITEFNLICESYNPKCFTQSKSIITQYSYLLENITNIKHSSTINLISDAFYYTGLFSYYSIASNKPNLEEALSSFIISAYLGNPKAQYKMYILFSSQLINEIITTKEFKNLINSNFILKEIAKTKFYSNFNLNDNQMNSKIFTNAIALQFLYSSALAKYHPAMLTLGYKYDAGYNVEQNCTISLSYYKQTAFLQLNEKLFQKEIRLIYFTSLERYEYINKIYGPKDTYTIDINELIDQYKLQTSTKKFELIPEIGFRYLIGVGSEPNFAEAFNWFTKGKSKNDTTSIYYLGEMYLNGWGVERNFEKAYSLFTLASQANFAKAYNSLGYMHYLGLFVEKNIDKAFELFQKAIDKDHDTDSYYDVMMMLLNDDKYLNIPNAYQKGNYVASQGHLYGTYMFAMMNHYQIGSFIDSCKITKEFFKNVAERSIDNLSLYTLAMKNYMNKKYAQSFLMFLDLAEMGYSKAIINVAILLRKYSILKNKKYQRYLYEKYSHIASEGKSDKSDLYTLLMLGDFHFENKNYKKALECYRKVANFANERTSENKKDNTNDFYISHSLFNLGLLINFGFGTEKNATKAERMFNLSTKYEDMAKYPVKVMKMMELIKEKIINGSIWVVIKDIMAIFVQSVTMIIVIVTFAFAYTLFYMDLKKQK